MSDMAKQRLMRAVSRLLNETWVVICKHWFLENHREDAARATSPIGILQAVVRDYYATCGRLGTREREETERPTKVVAVSQHQIYEVESALSPPLFGSSNDLLKRLQCCAAEVSNV